MRFSDILFVLVVFVSIQAASAEGSNGLHYNYADAAWTYFDAEGFDTAFVGPSVVASAKLNKRWFVEFSHAELNAQLQQKRIELRSSSLGLGRRFAVFRYIDATVSAGGIAMQGGLEQQKVRDHGYFGQLGLRWQLMPKVELNANAGFRSVDGKSGPLGALGSVVRLGRSVSLVGSTAIDNNAAALRLGGRFDF